MMMVVMMIVRGDDGVMFSLAMWHGDGDGCADG